MQTGLALTIGLNSVNPEHYSGWARNLNSCEADAIDMADIAKSEKFSTKVLIAKEGIRSNVIEEILNAAQSLKRGDIFMMAYSCNGGEVPDLNTLTDTYTLHTACLYDGQLINYELFSLLAKFQKGVRILIFTDSCHSGTVTKSAFFQGSIAARSSAVSSEPVRYKLMPQHVSLRTYRQNKNFYEKIIKKQS